MDHVQSSPEWQMFTVLVYLTQLIFSPAWRHLLSFALRTYSHVLSLAKLGTLKTQQNQPEIRICTHWATTNHTTLLLKDVLALRARYKSNPWTIKKIIFFFSCHIIKYIAIIDHVWKYAITGQSCRITHVWDKMSARSWCRHLPLCWGELCHCRLWSETVHSPRRWWTASESASHVKASKTCGPFLQDHLFYLSYDQEEFKQHYEKKMKTSFCSILLTALWHYFVMLVIYSIMIPSNCQRSQRMASLQEQAAHALFCKYNAHPAQPEPR